MIPPKIHLILLFFFFRVFFSNGQTITDYPYCQCTESIHYNENNLANGLYQVICHNQIVESGFYLDGNKDGTWEVKNFKGRVVSRIQYSQGKINGSYELFHFDGSPKLTAFFHNDVPKGSWRYYNVKGKVIKEGNYVSGKASGIWTIYNKKGKKKLAEYDFDQKKFLTRIDASYFNTSAVLSDEESGEYIILRNPPHRPSSWQMPLGDYALSRDYFAYLFNIPNILMNTVGDYNFKAKVKISNGNLSISQLDYEEISSLREEIPSFPFFVSTNAARHLTKVKKSDAYLFKLKERIGETLMVLGPWIGEKDQEMEIVVLIDLNPIIY